MLKPEQKDKLIQWFSEGRSAEYIINQMRLEGVFLTPSDVLRLYDQHNEQVEATLRYVNRVSWSHLLNRTLSVLDVIQDNLNPKRPDAVVTALRLIAEILKLRMTSEEERKRMEEDIALRLRMLEERGEEIAELQRMGIVRFREMEIANE
jgi:hypothetical protein